MMHPVHGKRLSPWVVSALAVLCLLIAARRAGAQTDTSLSGPVGEPVSSSLYSESQTGAGPSSSLLPGGTSLLLPSVRAGVSDPLGFLIETGAMTPFPLNAGQATSYAQSQVQSQTLNDPVTALKFSEYRNNRILMAGAASVSTPSGRAATAGSTLSGVVGVRTTTAGSVGRGAVLQPFAAGSSLLASRSGDSSSSFIDPNALLASARTSPSSIASYSGSGMGGSGAPGSSGASSISDLDALSAPPPAANTMGYETTAMLVPPVSATPGLLVDGGADAMPLGVVPGRTFPDYTTASRSATGFPDSTMGTAGLPESLDDAGISPLLWGPENTSGVPFAEMSGETSGLLHPTLRAGPAGSGGASHARSSLSVEEMARRMRLRTMVKNPQAVMPSAFARRAMIRRYERDRASGQPNRRPSHYPSIRIQGQN